MKIITPEFQKTIQELIDNLQAKQFSDEEYKLALKYKALPLGLDMFSYVFLNSDGEIIWDDNEGEAGSLIDLQGLIRALAMGTRRYPELANLIPKRSDESKVCPICEGLGTNERSVDVLTGKPGKCFFCAQLGWVTEEAYLELLKTSK